MGKLVVYGRTNPPCGYCNNLKSLLDSKEIEYEYKDVSDPSILQEFMTHRLRTVPAVFEDGVHIGGFDEISKIL